MRLLAFAYACEPEKGSEPGAGWVWTEMLASLGEVWVITRTNNRQAIESAPPRERTNFVYVDLPQWILQWKKGPRGALLYFLLWQFAAYRRARFLIKQHQIDCVWHLTIANIWLGSSAALLGIPFVYGPVGGGVSMSYRLLASLGWRGAGKEVLRDAVRTGARYLNPLTRISWHRAKLILVQNRETREWLPRRHRQKAEVFTNTVVRHASAPRKKHGETTMLFAGRLVPWKGASLAIEVLRLLPEWRLIVCGRGPDEERLIRLARKRQVQERIDFRGWVPPAELEQIMENEASVLVFPSLHDEGGWVVVEAATHGLPTVALDRGGPRELGAYTIHATWKRQTVRELADKIKEVRTLSPLLQWMLHTPAQGLKASTRRIFVDWSQRT